MINHHTIDCFINKNLTTSQLIRHNDCIRIANETIVTSLNNVTAQLINV